MIAELPYRFAVIGAAACFFASIKAGLGAALLRALVGSVAFWAAAVALGALAALQTTEE
jgi:hypothetical protein